MAGQYEFVTVKGVELGVRRRGQGKERRQERRDERGENKDARQNARQGGGQRLVETKPNVAKVKIMPLGTDLAGAATPDTWRLAQDNQNLFHPTVGVLQVETTSALGDWTVSDIKVGNKSQLSIDADAPASMFDALAEEKEGDFDMVPTGTDFIMEGNYIGAALGADITLCGGWYGDYFESIQL